MGWLAAQGAIMAIGLFIGLVCPLPLKALILLGFCLFSYVNAL